MVNKIEKKKFVILVWPSGSWKDTIRLKLEKEFWFKNLISTTSRFKRKGEINGVSYNFITKEKFEEKIKKGDFLEYVNYNWNYYGKDIENIKPLIEKEESIITILEKEWIKSILDKKAFFTKYNYDIIIIFLDITEDTIKERMLARGDDIETINKRIKNNDIWYFQEVKSFTKNIINANQPENIVYNEIKKILK